MAEELTHPSPHHSARNSPIRVIILHADASASERSTLAWFMDPTSKVSYHVLIGRNGTVYRIVEESRKAWHAGKAKWDGHDDVNGCSLGLSFANKHDGDEALTPIQIAVARDIVAGWRKKYPGIREVTTHAAVATPAGRKTDPLHSPGFALSDYTAV